MGKNTCTIGLKSARSALNEGKGMKRKEIMDEYMALKEYIKNRPGQGDVNQGLAELFKGLMIYEAANAPTSTQV